MTYVNGAVIPVPAQNKKAYMDHAALMAALFKKHGALSVQEHWEDDVQDGEKTSFPMAVKREEGEAVVLSLIVWPDKETNDKAWEAMMSDPLMSPETSPMPFDGSRMIFGSFKTAFSA